MQRPCIDCGQLIPRGTRCAECGTTTARGYGQGWKALSKRIIERDGGVCQIQRRGCTQTATTTDHIIPKSAGGTNDEWNLRAACRSCNSGKGPRVG